MQPNYGHAQFLIKDQNRAWQICYSWDLFLYSNFITNLKNAEVFLVDSSKTNWKHSRQNHFCFTI